MSELKYPDAKPLVENCLNAYKDVASDQVVIGELWSKQAKVYAHSRQFKSAIKFYEQSHTMLVRTTGVESEKSQFTLQYCGRLSYQYQFHRKPANQPTINKDTSTAFDEDLTLDVR